MRCRRKARRPNADDRLSICGDIVRRNKIRAYLQRHQQTFTLHVGEAEVDASRVTVGVAVPDDVRDTRVDAVDEAVGQLLHAGVISL